MIGDYDSSDSKASATNAMQDRPESYRGSQLVVPTVSIVATDESPDSSAPSYISAKRRLIEKIVKSRLVVDSVTRKTRN